MSDQPTEPQEKPAVGSDDQASGPKEVTLSEVESSQEELDLAELEEERRRIRNGLLFGFLGSGALVGLFYLLHEIFS